MFLATASALMLATFVAAVALRETKKEKTEADKPYRASDILRDQRVLPFLALCLMMYIVKGQLVATMSVHASSNIGLSKPQIGMLYFQNGAMVAILLLFIARILRSFYPLKAMIIASLIYAVGYLVVGHAAGMIGMIVAITIITIAEMIEAPLASAHVSRLAPERMTGLYMGGYNMTMHLGWTLGPLLGGLLLDNFNEPVNVWHTIAMIAIITAIGFAVLNRFESENVKGS